MASHLRFHNFSNITKRLTIFHGVEVWQTVNIFLQLVQKDDSDQLVVYRGDLETHNTNYTLSESKFTGVDSQGEQLCLKSYHIMVDIMFTNALDLYDSSYRDFACCAMV